MSGDRKIRAIRPTPERVERMLKGERARLALLEEEVAKTKEAIATLERTKARLNEEGK